jgi:hypothetical protein
MGRTAAESELVKWITPFITKSGLPWYTTWTVTVKGVPFVAVDGAVR